MKKLAVMLIVLTMLLNCGQEKKKAGPSDEKTQENIAKIVKFIGIVQVKRPGEDARRASLGTRLFAGDVLLTKKKSVCVLQIGDRSIVSIRPKTRLKIDVLQKNTLKKPEQSRLQVVFGTVLVKIRKVMKDDQRHMKMEIYTPTAVAGVRGTEFLIKVKGQKTDKIAVRSGKVRVRRRVSVIDSAETGKLFSSEVKSAVIEKIREEEVELSAEQEVTFDHQEAKKYDAVVNEVAEKAKKKIALFRKIIKQKEKAGQAGEVEKIKKRIGNLFADMPQRIKKKVKKENIKKIKVKKIKGKIKKEFKELDAIDTIHVNALENLKTEKDFNKKSALDNGSDKKDDSEDVSKSSGSEKSAEKISGGFVNMSLNPSNAKVVLSMPDGSKKTLGGGKTNLPVDTYQAAVSKSGYIDKKTTFTVTEGKTTKVSINLKKRIAISEKIILLDDTVIAGKITKQTPTEVTIITDAGTQKIQRAEIQRIQYLK